MTGKEIAEKLSGALETHHMEIEGDVYYYLEWMGSIIDIFNSPSGSPEWGKSELESLSRDFEEWYKELE